MQTIQAQEGRGANDLPSLLPLPFPSPLPLSSPLQSFNHGTLYVFLSPPHLALSRTSLTVKNTKDRLCVLELNICCVCAFSSLLFFFLFSPYIYPYHSIATYSPPNVSVCLSPEALQPGLILSVLQSPYLLYYLFIYPFFFPHWLILPPLFRAHISLYSHPLKIGADLVFFYSIFVCTLH